MQRHVITDGSSRYTRISKLEARKLFDKGESFYIIAHKMRPGMPFSMGMLSPTKGDDAWQGFDSFVANFCYYNANCNETGLYAAFYTVTERSVGVKA